MVENDPKSVIEGIRAGASRDAFRFGGYATLPGWSYHNQWWISHDDHGAFMARGIHGQAIYIDPKAEMVIAPAIKTEGKIYQFAESRS